MGAYYLDDRLSLIEGTRQFSDDGRGGGAPQEGFYGIAIRKRGSRDCVFRFTHRDRAGARLMLQALNQAAANPAAPPPDRDHPTT